MTDAGTTQAAPAVETKIFTDWCGFYRLTAAPGLSFVNLGDAQAYATARGFTVTSAPVPDARG